jgi:membrane protein required for colicin V production
MPITILDLVLLIVMLVSGLLAMVRGFMREVLSIVAWAVAALAAVFSVPRIAPWAKQFFGTLGDTAVSVIVGGSIFLLTLLIVSIFTVRISDMVLDSRIGALDRTLGFVFGLARGLIIVVVAFLFFAWFVPESRNQPDWVRSAKSKVLLQGTGQWLMSMLPDDPENIILKRLKRHKGDEQEPQDSPPDRRSGLTATPTDRRAYQDAYDRSDRLGMRKLVESQNGLTR